MIRKKWCEIGDEENKKAEMETNNRTAAAQVVNG